MSVSAEFSALAGYPYQRLDFDTYEIRILIVDGIREEDGVLSCSLEHISLIDPGPYTAVSYCWGDPNITKALQLDGNFVQIAANLDSALRAIWKSCVRTNRKVPRLWVDALCINQNNRQERSQQVRNMRQIYSTAEETVAWVGSGVTNSSWPYSTSPPPWDAVTFQAIYDLFQEPYWKRVWIIQEITVAATTRIIYGDTELQWENVVSLLEQLRDGLKRGDVEADHSFQNAIHLLEFRQHYTVERRPIELLEALEWSLHTLATDPRDKIYALLGLCHDGPTYVPVPNYAQPLEIILADMTKSMMNLSRNLNLLGLQGSYVSKKSRKLLEDKIQEAVLNLNCGESSQIYIDSNNSNQKLDISLPTWVPNWPRLWVGGMARAERRLLQHQKPGGDFRPILRGSTARKLSVRAVSIGEIQNMTSSMWPYKRRRHASEDGPGNLMEEHESYLGRSAEFYSENLIATLLETAAAEPLDMSSCSKLWEPEGRGRISDIHLIQWIDENAKFRIGPWSLPGLLKRSQNNQPKKKTPQNDIEYCILKLQEALEDGMKLACLDSSCIPKFGLPFALIHPYAESKDEIFLVKGCKTPLVLRKNQGQVVAQVGSAAIPPPEYRVIGKASLWARGPVINRLGDWLFLEDKKITAVDTLGITTVVLI